MGAITVRAERVNRRLAGNRDTTTAVHKTGRAAGPGEEERVGADPQLVIDVQGFEGPLDLLLHLARSQKVDLSRISILALAEQYLDFVDRARRLRLELAADYLVTAAWLAYLKSRLLVPLPPGECGESGEELAELLQLRLQRLEAMRDAAARLLARNRLGRDLFMRGQPETRVVERKNIYKTTLYQLLAAYAGMRQRQAVSHVEMGKRTVWSLQHARQVLLHLLEEVSGHGWFTLDRRLAAYVPAKEERLTALASAFAASLEMAREGAMEIRQTHAFAPLHMRLRQPRRDERRSAGQTGRQGNG